MSDAAGSSRDAELIGREKEQVEERTRRPAAVLYETIRSEGAEELERTPSSLAWSGLAAGLSMGFSMVAEGLLHDGLPDEPWRPLVSKLGYSAGFLIVILGWQQLFTEKRLAAHLFVGCAIVVLRAGAVRTQAAALAANAPLVPLQEEARSTLRALCERMHLDLHGDASRRTVTRMLIPGSGHSQMLDVSSSVPQTAN